MLQAEKGSQVSLSLLTIMLEKLKMHDASPSKLNLLCPAI